jgi:hypothetical protein
VIVKRGSGYGVRVYVDGRRKWVGTFKTRREARDTELEALRRPTSPREATCDAFAARWVADYPRPAAATRRTHTLRAPSFHPGLRRRAALRRRSTQREGMGAPPAERECLRGPRDVRRWRA